MHLLFRQAHVGALLDKPRRQAHRQVLWQLQGVEYECLTRLLARVSAEQGRELVARYGQMLFAKAAALLHLRQGRLLCSHVDAAGKTRVELLAQDAEHFVYWWR